MSLPASELPVRESPANDRGSATIWTAGAIAVVFLITAALLVVGAAVQTRHRAASAADLAALAAASYAPDGEQAACGRARWVTDRMGAQLVRCWFRGWDALVEVRLAPPASLVRHGVATAHARAGPTGS